MGRDMASPNTRVAAADTEAAEWHSRLGVRSVSTQTLEEFFAWRSKPANAEAYRRVEKVWAASGRLSGDPQMHDVLTEIMDRKPAFGMRERIRGSLYGVVGVLAAVALAFGAWAWMDSRSVYSTGVGEQRLLQLTDGSTVRLDTATRVRVQLSGDERRIILEEGQALFTVAHDRARPFIVSAGSTDVTAVGTVFDVRRSDDDVRVTLVSGAVDVVRRADAQPARMSPGQQARVSAQRLTTRAVDARTETSWTVGRLVFEDTPLRTAVYEVNRYLDDPIVLEGGDLGEVPVNGVFRTGDRDAFASATSEGLDLSMRDRSDGALILSRRTK